jgi:hypothetical protein
MKAFLAMSAWLASIVWVVVSLILMSQMIGIAIIISCLISFLIFRDTMNAVQSVGPVYWICRDVVPAGTPFIASGFMRQTSAPWRIGKGIQIKVRKHTFQIGISKVGSDMSDDDGLMTAIQGRFLKDKAKEIRDWK